MTAFDVFLQDFNNEYPIHDEQLLSARTTGYCWSARPAMVKRMSIGLNSTLRKEYRDLYNYNAVNMSRVFIKNI